MEIETFINMGRITNASSSSFVSASALELPPAYFYISGIANHLLMPDNHTIIKIKKTPTQVPRNELEK